MAVHLRAILILQGLLLLAASAVAQESANRTTTGVRAPTARAPRESEGTPANVLTPAQWRRVDVAVHRGLNWLATQQRPDGSFPTLVSGQPGVSSLCMMAFIAHGNVPGKGQFGTRLERATDYVLSCQKPS